MRCAELRQLSGAYEACSTCRWPLSSPAGGARRRLLYPVRRCLRSASGTISQSPILRHASKSLAFRTVLLPRRQSVRCGNTTVYDNYSGAVMLTGPSPLRSRGDRRPNRRVRRPMQPSCNTRPVPLVSASSRTIGAGPVPSTLAGVNRRPNHGGPEIVLHVYYTRRF